MTQEQAISNLKEIIELSRDEINKKDENLTAILDLIDLQSLEIVLSMLEEKDKQIDLMAEYISNITDCPFESEKTYLDCERMCDVRTDKECWKQYFENKAK